MQTQNVDSMLKSADNASKLLKAMSNSARLIILCMLLDGEKSVTQLNEEIDLSQSALSQHLAVLRKEQLVKTRKHSQTVYYSIVSEPVSEIIRVLYKHFCN